MDRGGVSPPSRVTLKSDERCAKEVRGLYNTALAAFLVSGLVAAASPVVTLPDWLSQLFHGQGRQQVAARHPAMGHRQDGTYGWGEEHHDQNNQPQQQVTCDLVVPPNPLTAQGLATPYLLVAPGDGQGNAPGDGQGNGNDGGSDANANPNADTNANATCNEASPNTAAFVQATIIDPATGKVSVYDPLVTNPNRPPAIQPPVPNLPAGAVVGVWVGFNGNVLRLVGPGAAGCVQGVPGSLFGQNAFCNATAFFQAANAAMQAGRLKPPPLGTAKDGRTCPSSRDFSLVDQDQSDNTTTQYLVTTDGRIAQDTPTARAALGNFTVEANGSDEGLLDLALDAALGCSPWKVTDLADTTGQQLSSAWALNELQAAVDQAQPVALIPALDPFVLVDNQPNLAKLNAYRAGTNQPQVTSLAQADTKTYCQNLLQVGLPRILADQPLTQVAPSPMAATANNLFTFIANRFHNTFSDMPGFLHCTRLLGVENPVQLTTNDAGVVVDATIQLNPAPSGSNQD
jgi:hypothetical protein